MKLISVQSRGNRLVRIFSEPKGHSVYGKELLQNNIVGFTNTSKLLAWPVAKKQALNAAENWLRGATE